MDKRVSFFCSCVCDAANKRLTKLSPGLQEGQQVLDFEAGPDFVVDQFHDVLASATKHFSSVTEAAAK